MDRQDICSFCGQPADRRCQRCGRTYCGEHGASFCNACSDPVSSLPSPRYVQTMLLGLPVCVILGIWFLVGNPRLPGEQAPSRNNAAAAAAPRTRAPVAAASVTPPPSTATATATATGADYTVKPGDTLASIAQSSGVSVAAITQLNPTIDPSNILVGQVLHMPPRSP